MSVLVLFSCQVKDKAGSIKWRVGIESMTSVPILRVDAIPNSFGEPAPQYVGYCRSKIQNYTIDYLCDSDPYRCDWSCTKKCPLEQVVLPAQVA